MLRDFSLIAFLISIATLTFSLIQIRLLRKNIETSRYQELIDKLFSVRNDVIDNPEIGEMFHANPKIEECLKNSGITVQEFFWLLKYLTVLENFYYQREKGVMSEKTWTAYVEKVKLVFSTPKIQQFWLEFSQLNTYRKDWVDFVDAVCNAKEIEDPILPKWQRLFK